MSYPLSDSNDPVALQADIARTRASLDRKLHELEYRLNPKIKLAQIKSRLDPRPYSGWLALAAVAAGAWMTIAGVRRYRFANRRGIDDPYVGEMMGE